MPNFHGADRSTRDYGYHHTKARAAAFRALPEYSPCCRCGRIMWKHAKDRLGRSALHYDHNRARTAYLGFSHDRCNREAGAAEGGRVATARHGRHWHTRTPQRTTRSRRTSAATDLPTW